MTDLVVMVPSVEKVLCNSSSGTQTDLARLVTKLVLCASGSGAEKREYVMTGVKDAFVSRGGMNESAYDQVVRPVTSLLIEHLVTLARDPQTISELVSLKRTCRKCAWF